MLMQNSSHAALRSRHPILERASLDMLDNHQEKKVLVSAALLSSSKQITMNSSVQQYTAAALQMNRVTEYLICSSQFGVISLLNPMDFTC